MNLTNEPWIPVRRADGSPDKIAPYQITDHVGTGKSPIIAVASPRPDFDGALVQFLIGLLQTTCTPNTEDEWWDWREQPPTSEELKARFEAVGFAFELEGEKAFMQDFSPKELDNELPISALLIDSPGDQSLDHNKDHFVKRGRCDFLCPHCSVMALMTMQINAPAGGRGYRTSLRGGGPLTTLVLGGNLWETCWSNTLEKTRYLGDEAQHKPVDSDRFPWLAKTRTSEAKPPAGITTSVDVHPDHIFWATPRRVRLIMEDFSSPEFCSLCSNIGQRMCRGLSTTNYGANYQNFKHGLSPYYVKDGASNPVHPQPGGIGYRHWLGLIESSTDGNMSREPARVIEQYRNLTQEDGRLWAFGYDMDNMKARCWYDATMPIMIVPKGQEGIFKGLVEKTVQAAHWVCGIIRGRIKDALFGDSDTRGDLSFIQLHFWNHTEAAFYSHARQLRDVLGEQEKENQILESWRTALQKSALAIFDHYAQVGDFDYVDPRTIAVARNDLGKTLNGKKLRDLLGLPQPDRKATKSQRKSQ